MFNKYDQEQLMTITIEAARPTEKGRIAAQLVHA
jgi:hypothetical protein